MGPQHYNYDELPMNWVGDWAGRRADLTPRRAAIHDADTGRTYSYAEMEVRANRVGAYLVDQLSLAKGDRVCYLGRNRIEAVDLYLACGKTGVVLAPLSYRLAAAELNDLLARIQPSALFFETEYESLVAGLTLPPCVKTRIAISDGACDFQSQVLATSPREVNVPLATGDTSLLIHTGGTMSAPKICVVPHRQMLWNSLDLMATAGGGIGERRELLIFPFFHIAGWNTLTPIYHAGGYCVLLRQPTPERIFELIATQRITHLGAVEALMQAMVDHPEFAKADLSSLKGVTTAGAPCVPRAMRPFVERGVVVAQAYGLTEGGPSNFSYPAFDQDIEEVWAYHKSIGKPMFHCDAKIVDAETGAPVKRGEVGVLCLRSMHNFGGYLDQPERTAATLREGGWIYSGDLAWEDERGFVYLVGRADNMFISGGENISPEEIEEVLARHEGVAQVVVLGVNDPRWGQAPLALVVPKEGATLDEDALLRFCEQLLARYKLPRRILIRQSLPVTGMGKIDRRALKQQYP